MLDDLRWPTENWGWFVLLSISFVASFLYRRAYLMIRRSDKIDRLGFSIIISEIGMATVWLMTAVFYVWRTMPNIAWVNRAMFVVLLLTVGWAWIQMEFAGVHRTQQVTAGAVVSPPDEIIIETSDYRGPNRRFVCRRKTDRNAA